MKHAATASILLGHGPRGPRRITPYGSGGDPSASPRPPSILIADPDADTRRRLAALLQNDELGIVEADGEEAVKRAAADTELDLAIVDSDLPGASRLRRYLSADVPIVLITPTSGPFSDAVAMALDAVGVLEKPVDEDDLRTIVWNLAVRS